MCFVLLGCPHIATRKVPDFLLSTNQLVESSFSAKTVRFRYTGCPIGIYIFSLSKSKTVNLNVTNHMKRKERFENIFLAISLLTFMMSLTQTAFIVDKGGSDPGRIHSFYALIGGWFALFSGGAGIAWIANPLLLLSWILISRNIRIAMIASIMATAASASFLLFNQIITDEAGHIGRIIKSGWGYWLWLSSCCSFAVGTVLLYTAFRNQQPTTP
jgi:hypothetical protein